MRIPFPAVRLFYFRSLTQWRRVRLTDAEKSGKVEGNHSELWDSEQRMPQVPQLCIAGGRDDEEKPLTREQSGTYDGG